MEDMVYIANVSFFSFKYRVSFRHCLSNCLAEFLQRLARLVHVNNWSQDHMVLWNDTVESTLFGRRQFFKGTCRKNDSIKANSKSGYHLLTSNSVNPRLAEGRAVNKEAGGKFSAEKETKPRDEVCVLYFWLNNKPRCPENRVVLSDTACIQQNLRRDLRKLQLRWISGPVYHFDTADCYTNNSQRNCRDCRESNSTFHFVDLLITISFLF